MILCPKCQKVYERRINFCTACGTPLPKAAAAAADTGSAATAPASATPTVVSPPAAAPETEPLPQAPARPAAPPPSPKPAPPPERDLLATPRPVPVMDLNRPATLLAPAASVADVRGRIWQEAQEELTQSRPAGVELLVNFHRILVAGNGSTLEVMVRTNSADQLFDVEVEIQSATALESAVREKFGVIRPGKPGRSLVELPLAREAAGSRVFQFSLRFSQLGRRKSFSGKQSVKVLKEPTEKTLHLDLSNIGNQVVQGGSNSGLGAENRSEMKFSDLVDLSKIRTVNDLLDAELKENFLSVPLQLETDETTGTRIICAELLNVVQPGTVLWLRPMDGSDELPLRLNAGPNFFIGRQSDACDVVVRFFPIEDKANVERTRAVSKQHVVGQLWDSRLFFRDRGQTNGAWLDTIELPAFDPGVELRGSGRLTVQGMPGAGYCVDARHCPAPLYPVPEAENERLWNGPPPEPKTVTGCVTFTPTEQIPAFHQAIWLLTEATFGNGPESAICMANALLAGVQGRLHHHRGCFWLENSAGNGKVWIDMLQLWENQVAPLRSGMILLLGHKRYAVTVEG